MKNRLFIITVCLLCNICLHTQSPVNKPYKTLREKLDALDHYCDSLLDESASDSAQAIASYALTIVPKNDIRHLKAFYAHLGSACEGTEKPDTLCISLYTTSLVYAKKEGDMMAVIDNMGSIMNLYGVMQTAAWAIKRDSIFKEIKLIKDTTKDETVLAKAMGVMENYYGVLGKTDTALEYALKDAELAKKLYAQQRVSSNFVANALYQVIRAFVNSGKSDKRLEYALEMRKYLVNNNSLLALVYMYAAEDYLHTKQAQKALLYYDSLNTLAIKVNNALVWNNMLEVNFLFSQIYVSKMYNQPQNAYPYAKRALDIFERWGYGYYGANVNYSMGNALLALKKYNEALPYLLKGVQLAKGQYGELYKSALRKTSVAYAGLGNLTMSYNYLDTFANVQDSLIRTRSDKAFADAEAAYQSKEKQHVIELNNVEIRAGKTQRIWLIAGLILSAGIGVLLVAFYANKRRAARMLAEKNTSLSRAIHALDEANQTKARLFSIISHDLRSPINQVYQFLKLQQLSPGMLTEAQRFELSEKIQTATGTLLETMEDLLIWSKTQMNQFSVEKQKTFVNIIMEQSIALLKLNSEAKNIQVVNNLPANLYIISDPYFLQTIVRNLLQNAIKACPPGGTVTVGYSKDDIKQMIYIENPGQVFTQAQYEQVLAADETGKSLSGLGLRLVDELSKKIGIAVHFTLTPGGQTSANLVLPV